VRELIKRNGGYADRGPEAVKDKNSRQDRARKLCAVAVQLFQNGHNVERNFTGSEIETDGLVISYRMPFGPPSPRAAARPPDAAKYPVATPEQKDPNDEPYGLDIWAPRKVLSVAWHDGGEPVVVSYRPGEWEARLEALAGGSESCA
jgi:hypothetical protein